MKSYDLFYMRFGAKEYHKPAEVRNSNKRIPETSGAGGLHDAIK